MLKKIIKTHTARLDFVDIIEPTFFTKRERRVIASFINTSGMPALRARRAPLDV